MSYFVTTVEIKVADGSTRTWRNVLTRRNRAELQRHLDQHYRGGKILEHKVATNPIPSAIKKFLERYNY